MNQTDYTKWEEDAALALSGKYNQDEIEIIIDWFSRIKGSEEREMVGSEEVDAMLKFVCAKDGFDLYNSLMARLFIYAPLILREEANSPHRG